MKKNEIMMLKVIVILVAVYLALDTANLFSSYTPDYPDCTYVGETEIQMCIPFSNQWNGGVIDCPYDYCDVYEDYSSSGTYSDCSQFTGKYYGTYLLNQHGDLSPSISTIDTRYRMYYKAYDCTTPVTTTTTIGGGFDDVMNNETNLLILGGIIIGVVLISQEKIRRVFK